MTDLRRRIKELEALLELHKCPECHLANDHKMTCSFRATPGAVNFLLRKRVAELEKDSARLDWAQEHLFEVRVHIISERFKILWIDDDGNNEMSEVWHASLRDAIDDAMKKGEK